jgi:hypothetical protein
MATTTITGIPGDVGGDSKREIGGSNASDTYTPPADEGGSHDMLTRPGHLVQNLGGGSVVPQQHHSSSHISSLTDFKLL